MTQNQSSPKKRNRRERKQTVRLVEETCQYPTYQDRIPPCQAGCPSGHDVRGWLSIVRGLKKPPAGLSWEEYAFQQMVSANPFPAVMGRVCPAPCQEVCNREALDGHVGINSIEQYIGDWAIQNSLNFPKPSQETDKKVAIVGGGVASLTAAYFLRLAGHQCTIFEMNDNLGGMMSFGIPSYRVPRSVLEHEIQRILNLGIEVKLNMRVGSQISIKELEDQFDAIFWGIGSVLGKSLSIPGTEALNCVDAISFLRAFNEGRLQYLPKRILVIGGGDTAMDVAAVARRIGHIPSHEAQMFHEEAVLGQTIHDVASVARREGAEVWIIYRRPIEQSSATEKELQSVVAEGVEIHENLVPVEVILDAQNRAKALRVMPVKWIKNQMQPQGDSIDIECSMIVVATGQKGDYRGIESLDNGNGQISIDNTYQIINKPGHFASGDAIKPDLLTAAIGQAALAVKNIDNYLNNKKELHHSTHSICVTTYEKETIAEKLIFHERLFLDYFPEKLAHKRQKRPITAQQVVGDFKERFASLTQAQAIAEAERCMSCGMCFECDNCVVYCPQKAIFKVKQEEYTSGHYVDTDHAKCTSCDICQDICPTGYIQMGNL